MFALVGIAIFFIGILLMIIAGIWGLVLAFQDSVTWGVLYLFVPFAALVFIIKKWSKKAVRNSFFLSLLGLVVMFTGGVVASLAGRSLVQQMPEAFETPEVTPLPPDALPGGNPEPPPQPVDAETEPVAPTTSSPTSPSPTPPSPPSAAQSAQSEEPGSDYYQTMMVGYAAYNQQDYQTALINFRRALTLKPGDQLATDAIQNTERIIQQQQGN